MSQATKLQAVPQNHNQKAKSPALQIRHHLTTGASSRFLVYLWKGQLDEGTAWLKRLFFVWVYRPFNHFCRFKLGLPTFNTEECCGCGNRLSWIEFQGTVDEEWQAVQACETANWGYSELPRNVMLPASTNVTECVNHNYPLSDATERYKTNGKPTIDLPKLDAIRLAGKIASTDGLVERFQISKAT